MRAERRSDGTGCAEIVRALEGVGSLGPEEPGLVVAVPVRSALGAAQVYARFAAAGDAPAMLWEAPGPGAWSFAGVGETWRLDAAGADRIRRTRAEAEGWLADIRVSVDPACAGSPRPRLFGGLAFRADERRAAPWRAFADASFVMPRWLYGRSGDRAVLWLAVRAHELEDHASLVGEAATITALLGGPEAGRAAPRSAPRACVAAMSPDAWAGLVGGALEEIRAHGLDKVVTAMHSHVLSAAPIDVARLLARMGAEYSDCTRFAFTRDTATFLGATPERLVEQAGLSVEVDALAGSIRRGSAADDSELVRRLVESEKDRREHALVVEAVGCALRPLCRVVEIPGAPRVRSLRNVHHLWSPVRATRARAGHVLDLVERLHPTPAVCGTPREAALGWIAAHEPMQRGWYAGAVGWFDGAGDGSFAVAIRSGVVERHQAWLYGGAGIVAGSDPAAEYAEVRIKQAPMLSALGVADGAMP